MSLFPQNVLTSVPVVEAKLDLPRILALPRRPVVNCDREGKRYRPEAQALAEYVTEKYSLGSRPCKCRELGYLTCITLLNPIQAWVLREVSKVSGAVGLIAVGGGKTMLGILAPLAVPDCKVAVILAKPDQRLHYQQAYLRLREHFQVPSFIFDDQPGKALEWGHIVNGKPALHFVPYSRLSRPDSTDLLERMNPDLIICDEAHSVSARGSSRTGRLLRYLAAHDGVRFCAWSGTLVKKSIRDQAHLMAHALGMGSPMPLDPDDVEAWAGVFDPSPIPDRSSSIAKSLYKVFDNSKPTIDSAFYDRGPNTGVRHGYRQRILETPGVISTRESSVAASVYMHERVAPKMPATVRLALAGARQGIRPDGEELVEATEIALCSRTVASGFHFYWAFPKREPEELIIRWFNARQAWNKELRGKLIRAEIHLDSPHLCANAAARFWQRPAYEGDLPTWQAETWPAWVELKDLVEPDPRVKWIDDFLARDAAEWAKEHKGIVWCQSTAFGRKVAEIAGLPYHGGGPEAEAKILAEDGSRSVIASLKAHGTGRDGLQLKFCEQLFAELPSSGDIWQQNLGRLCRPGQQEDSIETWVYLHVLEFKDALRKALRDAEFNESMTGNAQLLLAADMSFEL